VPPVSSLSGVIKEDANSVASGSLSGVVLQSSSGLSTSTKSSEPSSKIASEALIGFESPLSFFYSSVFGISLKSDILFSKRLNYLLKLKM